VLTQDGANRDHALLRAFEAGERLAAMLSLDSGVIEFAGDGDARLALGEISAHVPDGVILRDQAWYFDAVLEALGV
jgi:hypothetical protein